MIKRTISSPVAVFRWVMDPRVSPLRHLAPAQRFQATAVLGTMWATMFVWGQAPGSITENF